MEGSYWKLRLLYYNHLMAVCRVQLIKSNPNSWFPPLLSILFYKSAAEVPPWRGLGNNYCLTHHGECAREPILYKFGYEFFFFPL